MTGADLAVDHVSLSDGAMARRYFAKFDEITAHLARVAAAMEVEGRLDRREARILADHVAALGRSFRTLSWKYLMTGRETGRFTGQLEIDAHESGFPVAAEILRLAADALQAARHLDALPPEAELKDRMLSEILSELRAPTRLQYALSQRLYYQALAEGDLFWPHLDPRSQWLGEAARGRRRFLIDWAVYDSGVNLPFIYLMEVEDSGRTGLPKDPLRWPALQAHLAAQSMASLKLVTIARGVDADFDDLHPVRLRRFALGPLYSQSYTRQTGPMAEVLEAAAAPPGQDWALAWREERLESQGETEERKGWFGRVERQVYRLDPLSGGGESGASDAEASLLLPERPYQALLERDPPALRSLRVYVAAPGGRVIGQSRAAARRR